jgi:hypothetical protein
MRPVETIPGMKGGDIKENDGQELLKMSQYTPNTKIIKIFLKKKNFKK